LVGSLGRTFERKEEETVKGRKRRAEREVDLVFVVSGETQEHGRATKCV
jgi:hypothetical protein